MNVSFYKKTNNVPHLNETIATGIVTYCLTVAKLDFKEWYIGITKSENPKGENYKSWECINHVEAVHTIHYLLNGKNMINDNHEINGDEIIIYVYHL